ncbi:acyl-CoA dehydrogenase [Rhizocola hellebori]|uniref:Acyl-CoA dehydrogenase n=1 Tax=Rhizocola hellebori TaxID=1392758 RepID=A0A8J3VEH1_9ACTN|nr:acyl-CoA dehydrogenase family protein [Rhizocola hellebori]GIH03013.1 acyl-CoA dehydrogenase [Rhizocola hellebori]
MDLTEEQRAFVSAVDTFCQRECGTRQQRDVLTNFGAESHNRALYRKMADAGWLGINVEPEFGGAGGGMVDLSLFLEATARGMAPIGGFATTVIAAAAYAKFGTAEQKETILGGVIRGSVEAIAMSEPEAGSDVANLSCKAARVDGGYVINGQKTWCSNAHIADHILLVARTGSVAETGNGHHGLTMFMVPTNTEGLEIRGIDTMGGREVNDLFYTDCFLPASAVVGEVGNGWRQLMAGLNTERIIMGGLMLGTAQRAFDDTLSYVTQRKQFGQPVGTFQALRHRLADLATEIECCRLLVYDVASKVDANPEKMLPREASMVKLKVTETAKRMALEGMQMMGGYGYAKEFDMEGHVRRTIVSTIYGGTNEIQRDIIGKTYGL